MKRFFFLLLSTLALLAGRAQSDTVQFDIQVRHAGYIVAFMADKGEQQKVALNLQMAAQIKTRWDSTLNRRVVADTAQWIKVVSPKELVPNLYLNIGSQQERLTTEYNAELKRLIWPALERHPDLLAAIMEIARRNAQDTWQLIQWGLDYLLQIKPQ